MKSTDKGCNSTKHLIRKGNISLLKESKTTFSYCTTFLLGTSQPSHQAWSDPPSPKQQRFLLAVFGFGGQTKWTMCIIELPEKLNGALLYYIQTSLWKYPDTPVTYSFLEHISPQHLSPTELHSLLDTTSRPLPASPCHATFPSLCHFHTILPAQNLLQTIREPLWVIPLS